tara:strand:- start:1247 stop:2272 length:1026 start_codon:yes stop_codon:yes gene_type:complete
LKNLSIKLLDFIKEEKNLIPNLCQIEAALEIENFLSFNNSIISSLVNKPKLGIYIHGSVGIGKSILADALETSIRNLETYHFSDFMFQLQKISTNRISLNKFKKKFILIDEFFINNLASLVLFKNFLKESKRKTIILISNKPPKKIYFDKINLKVCEDLKKTLSNDFYEIFMKSDLDFRKENRINNNFFLINDNNYGRKQNLLRQSFSNLSRPEKRKLIRKGNSFIMNGSYENLLDVKFDYFFQQNLNFQDYELVSKNWKYIILRNMPQIKKDSSDLISRFITFIDVIYKNKNILSLSTRVNLDKLYIGEKKGFEFKRTLSRLNEIGSNEYINKYFYKTFY